MAITDALVLPEEVMVLPVTELASASRAELDCDDGDFVVTRPYGRPGSALIDPQAVELVSRFRAPQRIVDAVVAWCAESGADPEQALTDAFPVFDALYRARLLVEDGSPLLAGTEPVLAPGARIGPFTIERLVQAVDPTDVYEATGPDGPVAVKLVRTPGDWPRPCSSTSAGCWSISTARRRRALLVMASRTAARGSRASGTTA